MKIIDSIAEKLGYIKSADVPLIASNYGVVTAEWGNDDVLRAFNQNEWLFSAVGVVASEIANINIHLVRVDSKTGEEKKVLGHPAMDLLHKPNGIHSGSELRETIQIHQELVGNGYLLADGFTGRNSPTKLMPLDPTKVKIKRNNYGEISYYEYCVGTYTTKIDPLHIVHFRSVNPRDLHYGAAPSMATAFSVDTDMTASKWNRNFFKNSARPDFLLFISKMKKEARERFKRRWKQEYGGEENNGKAGIIEDENGKVHEFPRSQKDMDFVEQGKSLRDKIIANYRVPKSLLGMTEEVNRASMEASIYIFARYTLLARIKRFCEKLTIDYLPLFGNDENLKFTFDDPVPENSEAKLNEIQNGLANGWMTINEARKERNLDPVDNGDVILVPYSKIALGDVVSPSAEAKNNENNSDSKKQLEVKKKKNREHLKAVHLRKHGVHERRFKKKMNELFEKQQERAMSRLMAQKDKEKIDVGGLLIQDQESLTFIKETTQIFEVIIEDGGKSVFERLGKSYSYTNKKEFDFDSSDVRTMIATMQIKFAREVNQTTIEKLREVLEAGVAEGESSDELADRVKEVFTEAKKERALMIARTETTKAFNGGTMMGYEQAGVTQKEWLGTDDGRGRESHVHSFPEGADGQKVGTKDKFLVDGEYLDYPGDPAGSPHNIINCRCTMLP